MLPRALAREAVAEQRLPVPEPVALLAATGIGAMAGLPEAACERLAIWLIPGALPYGSRGFSDAF